MRRAPDASTRNRSRSAVSILVRAVTERRALGIDFGGTKVAVAVAGPDGRILDRAVLEVRPERGADQVVDRTVAEARRLLAATGTDRPAAVGVSGPGYVHEDRVELAPNVPGWDRLALPGRLHEAFGAPAVFWNDAKAAALGELRWGALRGVREGIYVNLGTGLSTAFIMAGEVMQGAHGTSGEIGYSLRWPGEGPGVAEGRSPLEEWAAGAGLRLRAAAELGREMSAAELARSADADPRARALLSDATAHLIFHLTNLAIATDPARVVVGGGLLRALPDLVPGLEAAFGAYLPHPAELRPAAFTDDAPLRGAVALALDHAG